jgi:DNA-binding LacI/PurR family transcriptional regulator
LNSGTQISGGKNGSRPVKLSDVAEAAGVSLSTVSRVLNRRKFFERLSQATVERVNKAAEALNYQPHHVAQTLATNRSMVIGVYVHVQSSMVEGEHPMIGNSYAGEILSYAERFFRERGYDLLIINLSAPQQTLKRCATKFHNRQVDGILTVYSAEPEELCFLNEQQVPAVAIDYAGPKVPVSYVGLDNHAAINLAVDHLVNLGHRNIGFLGACHPETFSDWRLRHTAFLEGMARHQLPVKYDLSWPNTPLIERKPDFQFQEGIWAIDFLSSRADRPTALVTISDGQAFAATRRMGELGWRCPQEMSVVGFDDSFLARWSRPSMTSISHNLKQMTNRACEILLGHIEQWYDQQAWQVVHEKIYGALTIRESTAPPPTRTE